MAQALKHSDIAAACMLRLNQSAMQGILNAIWFSPDVIASPVRSAAPAVWPADQRPTRGAWTCLRRIEGEDCNWEAGPEAGDRRVAEGATVIMGDWRGAERGSARPRGRPESRCW